MMVVTLIIVFAIVSMMNASKKPAYIIVPNNAFVCSEGDDVIENEHIIKDIKEEILYHFNNANYRNRETIVRLLSNLQEYDDPGDFLDSNPHICGYIFNREVG